MSIQAWAVIGIIMGIISGVIAQGKNRSAAAWGIFGFLFPILATIIIAVIAPAPAKDPEQLNY